MRQSILGAIALAICASHVGINDRALADEPVVSCTLMKEWPPHSAFSQQVFRLPTAEARDADLLAQSEPEKCGKSRQRRRSEHGRPSMAWPPRPREMPGKQRLNTVAGTTLLLNPRESYPDPHREVARGWYICRKSGDATVCAAGQATGLFVRGRCTRESLLAARARSKARPSAARAWRQSCRLRVLRTSRRTATCSDAPRESR